MILFAPKYAVEFEMGGYPCSLGSGGSALLQHALLAARRSLQGIWQCAAGAQVAVPQVAAPQVVSGVVWRCDKERRKF
jgi:hypothetical protein